MKRLTAGRTLLEIGSSWGYFLDQANAAGFATVGVEPGRTRRRFGVRELGVDIRVRPVTGEPQPQFDRPGDFDTVGKRLGRKGQDIRPIG